MFDRETLESTRERAAVLALMTRRLMPWNRLAGAIEEAGSALQLLEQLEDSQPERLFNVTAEKRQMTLDELEELVLGYEAEGIAVTTVLDSRYPANLRLVHDRPPALFIRGSLSDADERSIAVVGTRKASARGLEQTELITSLLAEAGYVVVSGLAAGIDTAAHRAALEQGARTVAVIGTGLREHFPKQNAQLQEELAEQHAVISQFWPGQGPRPWTFPQRNAVMSGFARATVVVEAGHTSGARMQARLAVEHGRPAFVLESLLEHAWAQNFVRTRSLAYVVSTGDEIADHLERLYSDELVPSP